MQAQVPGESACVPGAHVLGYLQSGAPGGVPFFFFHGYGGSRLSAHPDGSIAARIGVRVIALDRPGIGYSSFQPGRTLLDWPDDVAALADQLGIERFAVLAHSWGSPYALACAYKIPQRLIGVGVASGVPPLTDPDAMPNLPDRLARLAQMAQRSSWRMRSDLWLQSRRARQNPTQVYEDNLRATTGPDRAVMSDPALRAMFISADVEPFREGITGMYWDRIIPTREWGFRLRDITMPVHLWYGEQDASVSPAVGQYLAEQMPHAQLTVMPDAGHLLIYSHWGEILAALTGGASR
jgi:pimeloyl-ACP methyl ester carboxylesterase